MIASRAVQMPQGVTGSYKLDDGHEVMLHQDRHGTRLTRLGGGIKHLLSDSQVSLPLFDFDAETRSLAVVAGT